MWISGLHIPESYLTALVQATCRRNGWPLDRSTLFTQVTKFQDADEVSERAGQGTVSSSWISSLSFRISLPEPPPIQRDERRVGLNGPGRVRKSDSRKYWPSVHCPCLDVSEGSTHASLPGGPLRPWGNARGGLTHVHPAGFWEMGSWVRIRSFREPAHQVASLETLGAWGLGARDRMD